MTATTTVTVKRNPDSDELYFELPEDLLKTLGWEPGDEMKFEACDRGAFILKKVKYETVSLDLDQDELYRYMLAAHEQNMSFNEFVEHAVTSVLAEDSLLEES